ncbi:hypothetical protein D3C78_1641790 [compost metagenome]
MNEGMGNNACNDHDKRNAAASAARIRFSILPRDRTGHTGESGSRVRRRMR